MAKYRITVEMIEGEDREAFEEKHAEGTECSGFVILAKEEDGHESNVCGVSMVDIAKMIASNSKIRAAAAIAEGIVKARSIEDMGRIEKNLGALFAD